MKNSSVADPDPGSSGLLTPGSGMGKKSESVSGIGDEKPGSYFRELKNNFFLVKILKFFDVDPGWKNVGSPINIPDPLKNSYRYVKSPYLFSLDLEAGLYTVHTQIRLYKVDRPAVHVQQVLV
jgi:hypothetical protein